MTERRDGPGGRGWRLTIRVGETQHLPDGTEVTVVKVTAKHVVLRVLTNGKTQTVRVDRSRV